MKSPRCRSTRWRGQHEGSRCCASATQARLPRNRVSESAETDESDSTLGVVLGQHSGCFERHTDPARVVVGPRTVSHGVVVGRNQPLLRLRSRVDDALDIAKPAADAGNLEFVLADISACFVQFPTDVVGRRVEAARTGNRMPNRLCQVLYVFANPLHAY